MKYFNKPISLGFTLIELLVVIAILGVLAGGVLVAINPLEQLARGRDAGRKTTVDQLGKAIQSYYISQSATYPPQDTNWITSLRDLGELKANPSNPTGGGYTNTCGTTASEANGFCYEHNDVDAVVYVEAESISSENTAGDGDGACANTTWIVWSSYEGKTGVVCLEGAPEPSQTGLK